MGQATGIQWCDHTWSPWYGCQKVTPGCAHCYAESLSKRNPAVLGTWGPEGTRVISKSWDKPLAWDRAAARAGVRRRVFPSLCDPFEDRPELIGPREQLFGLIDRTPNLIWLLLTKRPENIRPLLDHELMPSRYWPGAAHKTTWDDLVEGNIPNLWLGVSCEDQRRAEERIPHLLATPAAVRFLSVEPLLEAVDLTPWMTWHPSRCPLRSNCDWAGPSCPQCGYEPNYIDWVICGGESGPGARPMHPDWARSIRDQCIAAGVAFHFKQWGEWAPVGDDTPRGAKLVYVHRRGGYTPTISGYEPGCPCDSLPSDEPMARVGKHAAGRLLDGREWNEFPEAHAHA